jgi:pimeloyl-ACP methyl ester carboxylesterase
MSHSDRNACTPILQRFYERVPQEAVQRFFSFRASYPPKTFSVAGRSWEYLSLGQGPETVLFLHGLAGTYDIWWHQILALRDNFRVLSLTTPPIDTLESLRTGLNALLAHEGIDRFAAVGSSYGGYIVQYLLTRQPERIQRAVLANTLPPNHKLARWSQVAEALIPLVPSAWFRIVFRLSTELRLYPASGRSEFLRAFLNETTYRNMNKDLFLARYRAVIEWFDPPKPESLEIPMLIIESANDPLIDKDLRRMLKLTYPEAKVFNTGNVGHFPYVNQPDAYNQALASFLIGPPAAS